MWLMNEKIASLLEHRRDFLAEPRSLRTRHDQASL